MSGWETVIFVVIVMIIATFIVSGMYIWGYRSGQVSASIDALKYINATRVRFKQWYKDAPVLLGVDLSAEAFDQDTGVLDRPADAPI